MKIDIDPTVAEQLLIHRVAKHSKSCMIRNVLDYCENYATHPLSGEFYDVNISEAANMLNMDEEDIVDLLKLSYKLILACSPSESGVHF